MGLNITQMKNGFQFESNENLRNAAKNILNRQGASSKATQKILEETVFKNDNRSPQLEILSASSQITLNNSLKETLKYLNSKANQKNKKKPVLGELWEKTNKIEDLYEGELVDFIIDSSIENIFTAA